jgi:outer membrane protein OmpU
MIKKILLTTTAIALLAAPALAEDVKVKVIGLSDFQAGVSSQKSQYKNMFLYDSANQKSYKFVNTTRAALNVEGVADNGIKYGAVAVLLTSKEKQPYLTDNNSTSYIYLNSEFGQIELGSNYAVSKNMKVDTTSIMAGHPNGSENMWATYVNGFRTGDTVAFDVNPILVPETVINRAGGVEPARKITWVSPRYSGFQFGLDFIPDASNTGSFLNQQSSVGTDALSGYVAKLKDVVNTALNYTNNIGGFDLAVAATYDHGKYNNPTSGTQFRNLKAWTVGGAVGMDGISFAASYGTDGKSEQAKNASNKNSYFWTSGLRYEQGPLAASLTYFNSNKSSTAAADKKINVTKAVSLGTDYKLAPGLIPYAELSYYNIKVKNQTPTLSNPAENKGTVFILGTSVLF